MLPQIRNILSCVSRCFPCGIRILTDVLFGVYLIVPSKGVMVHDSFNSVTYYISYHTRYKYAFMCRFTHLVSESTYAFLLGPGAITIGACSNLIVCAGAA